MEQLSPHRKDFHEFDIWVLFETVEKIRVSLKPELHMKTNTHSDNVSRSSS